MNDDELNDGERRALDTWTALTPPAGFADRVLDARDDASVEAPSRKRWPYIAAGVVAAAAAAVAVVALRAPDHSSAGELVAADRTQRNLGDRAVIVAEPTASLSWNIDRSGDAVIDQRAGDVFYRVERGGTFVVHTPSTDVHVTGTCFRIEVIPMNKQMILSAAAGAALASAVIITVYEGHVIADSRHGERTNVAAGNQVSVSSDGKAAFSRAAMPSPTDTWNAEQATREDLIARTQAQQSEIIKLRARVGELESSDVVSHARREEGEPGRAWYDPSDERLAQWAKDCHIRVDEPGVDRWEASTTLGKNPRGLEPGELSAYNAAIAEVQQKWKALVKSLYIEATGDTAGAEILSNDAMRGEIEEKSARDEHNSLLQQISAENAGLAKPPLDWSKLTPFERLFRTWLTLGDQTEAAIAKRLGAERAKAIRGEAWDSRSDMSGCPDKQ
jgi:hypothetical protein